MEKNKNLFKFSKESFNFAKIKDSIIEFFLSHSELLFMVFFVIIAILSSLLIYKYIYSSVWSDEEREAYLQSLKSGEAEFNLNNFNSIAENVKEREALYNTDITENVRDIFNIEK